MLRPAIPGAPVPVDVVIPARDEANSIVSSVRSLLAQDYAGPLRIIVVDDGSTDGTGMLARAISDQRLLVITGRPRPPGWSGKLWAVAQGLERADAGWVLLTDADIVHAPAHVATLMAKAEKDRLDLVSEMVALRCQTWAERALVPAFVFFFQLLFPFAWVNNPARREAAAAGGTTLVRAAALVRIGGIGAIRGHLIDDVAMAAAIKRDGRIWLGHSGLAQSVRPYAGWRDVWAMVARTAYVQLRHSPWMLGGTVAGLALVWFAGPAMALSGHGLTRWLGLAAWIASCASLLPTLRRFGVSPVWALAMPLIAAFYMAATLGSAVQHHRGRGTVWKTRAYGVSTAPLREGEHARNERGRLDLAAPPTSGGGNDVVG